MKRSGENSESKKSKGQDFVANKRKMKKNMKRLGSSGRGGLSLESFANARTRNDNFNPALIKKQREFYKNAKHVQKYKKSLKKQEPQTTRPTADRNMEGEEEVKKEDRYVNKHDKKSNNNFRSLERLYERTKEEEEKARMEREATIQAKNEKIRIAEARRRNQKENMYKKTKHGQPVMKFRIEHLLETLQGSTS